MAERVSSKALPMALVIVAALVSSTVVTLPLWFGGEVLADDYRYIWLVECLRRDFFGALPRALVVENGWTHLWWIDSDSVIRFFRPTIVLSYWFDLWRGGEDLSVLFQTNALIHIINSVLVALLLVRIRGAGWINGIAAVMFAVMACHVETLFYVAGRTDSLAATFFLAAFLAHIHYRYVQRSRYLRIAVLGFGAALFTKELTALLPAVCYFYDLWFTPREKRSSEYWTQPYLLYLGCGAFYFVLRGVCMPEGAYTGELVRPYFVLPRDPGFVAHLATQFKAYFANFFIAVRTSPFLTADALGDPPPLFYVVLALLAAGVYWLRKERELWLAFVLAFVTWLPTSIVYISERYLYLPSVAVVLVVALALSRAPFRALQGVGVVFCLAWILLQGSRTYGWLYYFGGVPDSFAPAPRLYSKLLDEHDPELLRGRKLLLVNWPGNWVEMQFSRYILAHILEQHDLESVVLTNMPLSKNSGHGSNILLTLREGVVGLNSSNPLMISDEIDFPPTPFSVGTKRSLSNGINVEVTSGTTEALYGVQFDLPDRLNQYAVLQFVPALEAEGSTWEQVTKGRVEVVFPEID